MVSAPLRGNRQAEAESFGSLGKKCYFCSKIATKLIINNTDFCV